MSYFYKFSAHFFFFKINIIFESDTVSTVVLLYYTHE